MAGRTKFTATKGIKSHPYGDPTYLSFFFLFDWYSSGSPLFNGAAEDYLRNFCGDTVRADKLKMFINYLKRINTEMPWFWQSIDGLNMAHEYGGFEDAYSDAESEATIKCLETVDFTIAGILDIYRNVCYDFNRYVEVLPKNLREFTLYVHVQEIRNFVPFIGTDAGTNLQNKISGGANKASGALSNMADIKSMGPEERKAAIAKEGDEGVQKMADRLNADGLDWKSKGMGPRFVTKLNKCEFMIDGFAKIFESLSNIEMNMVSHSIKFKWKTSSISNQSYLQGFKHEDPDIFSAFDNEILNDLANSMVKGAINQGATMVDAASQRVLDNFKSKLLLGNVYGANTASKIQDVLNAGSINSLGPLLSGDKTDNSETPTVKFDSIFPATNPEQPLESTKMFEKSDPEQPLSSENVNPPPSTENDSTLGNIHD